MKIEFEHKTKEERDLKKSKARSVQLVKKALKHGEKGRYYAIDFRPKEGDFVATINLGEEKKRLRELMKKRTSVESKVNYIEYDEKKQKVYEKEMTGKLTSILGLKVKVDEGVGVHPSITREGPVLDRENKILKIRKGNYWSTKHNHSLNTILSKPVCRKGVQYMLITVTLNICSTGYNFGGIKSGTWLLSKGDGNITLDRLPSTVGSVDTAIEYMKPAEVRKAEQEKRKVHRQGDIFFVEMKTKKKNLDSYVNDLPKSHVFDNENMTITHNQHSTIQLEHPYFKPVQRKVLVAGGD